jgi:hypothetical protein
LSSSHDENISGQREGEVVATLCNARQALPNGKIPKADGCPDGAGELPEFSIQEIFIYNSDSPRSISSSSKDFRAVLPFFWKNLARYHVSFSITRYSSTHSDVGLLSECKKKHQKCLNIEQPQRRLSRLMLRSISRLSKCFNRIWPPRIHGSWRLYCRILRLVLVASSHTTTNTDRSLSLQKDTGSSLKKRPLTLRVDSFANLKATRTTTKDALLEMDCLVTLNVLESDGAVACRQTSTAASQLHSTLWWTSSAPLQTSTNDNRLVDISSYRTRSARQQAALTPCEDDETLPNWPVGRRRINGMAAGQS